MEDKRQHIIETSKKLFSEKGFSATGLREISERSGISIGNIYNYFQNKEEIFNHTLDPDDIINSLTELQSLLNENMADHFDKLILKIKEVVDQNLDLYRLIFIDLIEFGGFNTNRALERIIGFVTTIFQKRIDDSGAIGERLKDLDYPFYIKIFIVTMISLFVTNNILPSAKIENHSDEEMTRMLADVILNGVLV